MSPLDRQPFVPPSSIVPPPEHIEPPHHELEHPHFPEHLSEHRSYVPRPIESTEHSLHSSEPMHEAMVDDSLVGPEGIGQKALERKLKAEAKGWNLKTAKKYGLNLGGEYEDVNVKKFAEETVRSLPKAYGGVVRMTRQRYIKEVRGIKSQQLQDLRAGKSKEYYGGFKRLNLLKHLFGWITKN